MGSGKGKTRRTLGPQPKLRAASVANVSPGPELYYGKTIHPAEEPYVRTDGTQEWYERQIEGPTQVGGLHRVGGPARILPDGEEEWWFRGAKHRLDGPAVIWAEGARKEWWRDNKLHREDGPAVEEDGFEEWHWHGSLHRNGGPAIIARGGKEWWVHGQRHREDGPAMDHEDGHKQYWLLGQPATEEETREIVWREYMKTVRPGTLEKVTF